MSDESDYSEIPGGTVSCSQFCASDELVKLLDKWSCVLHWRTLAECQAVIVAEPRRELIQDAIELAWQREHEYERVRRLVRSLYPNYLGELPRIDALDVDNRPDLLNRAQQAQKLLGFVVYDSTKAAAKEGGGAFPSDRATQESSVTQPSTQQDGVEIAPDYSWLRCELGQFTFTPSQRPIVSALYDDWQKNGCGLSESYLLDRAGKDDSNLRDIFKDSVAWKYLIGKGSQKDMFQLKIPKKSSSGQRPA